MVAAAANRSEKLQLQIRRLRRHRTQEPEDEEICLISTNGAANVIQNNTGKLIDASKGSQDALLIRKGKNRPANAPEKCQDEAPGTREVDAMSWRQQPIYSGEPVLIPAKLKRRVQHRARTAQKVLAVAGAFVWEQCHPLNMPAQDASFGALAELASSLDSTDAYENARHFGATVRLGADCVACGIPLQDGYFSVSRSGTAVHITCGGFLCRTRCAGK